MRKSSSTFYKSTKTHCADSLSYPIVFRASPFLHGSGIGEEVWAHERAMERLQDSYPLKVLDGIWQGSFRRMKIHFQLAVLVIIIITAMLWRERRFCKIFVKNQVASRNILAASTIQALYFLTASPCCHSAFWTLYKVFLGLSGNEMEWVLLCHSRLKTKCRKENFHYYEVVFKANDDLQGLRTETPPFHLAT